MAATRGRAARFVLACSCGSPGAASLERENKVKKEEEEKKSPQNYSQRGSFCLCGCVEIAGLRFPQRGVGAQTERKKRAPWLQQSRVRTERLLSPHAPEHWFGSIEAPPGVAVFPAQLRLPDPACAAESRRAREASRSTGATQKKNTSFFRNILATATKLWDLTPCPRACEGSLAGFARSVQAGSTLRRHRCHRQGSTAPSRLPFFHEIFLLLFRFGKLFFRY